MKRRIVVAVILMVTATAGLLASGSQQDAAASPAGAVELTFVTQQYDINLYEKAVVQAYMKERPSVKVAVVDITGQGGDYMNKLSVMLAGGEKVDVNMLQDPMFYSMAVLKGQALALDDLVAKDKFNLKPFGSVLAEHRWSDGKLYGLPERTDHWILYYNKKLFEQAGLPYPKNSWTWNDFREVALKLSRGEGANRTYGAYIHTWPKTYYLMGLIRGEGNIADGTYAMLKDGMQFLFDIQTKDKSAQDYATNKATAAHYRGFFEKDNLPMVYMGTWLTSMLITDKKAGKHNVNWDVVQLPQLPGKGDATMGTTTPYVIQPKSKFVPQAWDFLKYLCGEPGAKIIAGYGWLPSYRSDDVMKIYTSNPDLPAGMAAALKTDKVYLDIAVSKNSALLNTMINEEIDLFASGNKTIDQTIKDMEGRRKEILASNP